MPAFEVLVCCVGNLCRSPYAERLLARRLADAGALPGDVTVRSAGTRAVVGASMPAPMALRLWRSGGDPEGFVARQVDVPTVDRADLVLTATRSIRSRLLQDSPAVFRRTFTILELAALAPSAPRGGSLGEALRACDAHRPLPDADVDLVDPINQPDEVYDDVAARLDVAVAAIADVILANLLDDPALPRGTRSR